MTGPERAIYEFPTTPTQASLWFIHQLDPTGTAYNIPASFEIRGRLDTKALRASFDDLMCRHEILRTVFVFRDGEVLQRVIPKVDLDWKHHERDSATSQELVELAESEVRRPFDLMNGPLLRIRLWSFGEELHLLTFVFHHIVVDHLSCGQFSSELTHLYRARKNGVEPTLPELELQFADYSVWFLDNALPAATSVGLDHWVKQLSGFSGSLDLPIDEARSSTATTGAEHRFRFPKRLSEQVRAFARSEGLSLFNVTLGALQVLLHHYCGQDDIIVGTPFGNRGEDERLDAVMGCFINTLPIGILVDPAADFHTVVGEARAALFAAHEHQAVPFDAIVNALTPHRELGLNPLYQVGFVFQEPPIGVDLEGVQTTDLAVHSGGAMYDLHMWLWESGGYIEGTLCYDSSLFDEGKVTRLTDRYAALAERLVSQPDAPVGEVSIATEEDAAKEAEANATSVQWDGPSTVLDLVAAQAEATPERAAVVSGAVVLSYAELLARAKTLAASLYCNGVREADLVGVYLDRGPDLIPALLAVQLLGAAYVPMDPEYPVDRLGYIAAQAGLCALISGQGAPSFDLPEGCQVVDIDGPQTDQEPECPGPGPDSTLYTIFTSGSTGHPKGVSVPQRCVVNLLRSMAMVPGLDEGPTLLAVTTLSFDIAVLELFLPLITGGTVILAEADEALDGQELANLMAEHAVTAMQATPSSWRLLLDSGWEGVDGLTALCGGEGLPPELAEALVGCVHTLWNVYGPTETTVWSTLDRVTDDVTIGRPIANTTCRVLNSRGVQLPSDVVGELFIGGAGVTDGYYGRPDLTAERFVDDPFGEGRLYRTGDLVRRLSDGRLQYLGRSDDQVKVNGYRIELGEVESALNSHKHVRQAVAAVQRGDHGDARLLAFVVPAEGTQLIGSELRRHARQTLPDYMIPGVVTVVESIPLTPNGKVDRARLLETSSGMFGSRTNTPPATDAERLIAGVWSEALGLEAVSREDNFFELGGHSLLAIRVAHELGAKLNVGVDPRSLFFSSLAQLAGTAS